ncbi:MAG TPA: B-box zinc finger protein [Aggregatilineales bacterium]|nr:B-box zinc finger protein [Aggregatilineales bacterium]
MADPVVETPQAAPEMELQVCAVHPKIETSLRCNRCGRLMCNKCAVRTPVGYRCRECVRGQQQTFYNAQTLDPVIQGAISLVLGGLAASLMGLVGFGFFSWLIAFWAGGAAGALIADLAYRAVSKRRGRYSWLVVAGGIIAGAIVAGVLTRFSLAGLIFTVMAVSAAMGRLRLGR